MLMIDLLWTHATPSKVKELERRIKNLRDKAAQIEAVNNPRIEAKKELFKNAQTYLFGKTGVVEETTNNKSTNTVEAKPEEVKATAVKKIKDSIFDVISDLDTLDERKNDILINKDNLKVVSVDIDCILSYERTYFFDANGFAAFYIYGEFKVWSYLYNGDFVFVKMFRYLINKFY